MTGATFGDLGLTRQVTSLNCHPERSEAPAERSPRTRVLSRDLSREELFPTATATVLPPCDPLDARPQSPYSPLEDAYHARQPLLGRLDRAVLD
jgi:hypothetical protein